MKTCVVYYSMSGNTEMVARQIADLMNADTIKLMPKKEYPNKGLKKYLWGGRSAIMGDTPELEDYSFSNDYDCIILGSPIWASNIAPPLNTFIHDNMDILKDKKVAVYVCQGGSGADKAIKKLKDKLEITNELVLIDPKDKQNKENDKLIKEFCKKI